MFCQAAVPSFSTKLSCQWAEMKDKWLQNRQKWRKNREIWQKPTKSGRNQTKNDRKRCKMRSFTNNLLSSFPFLSCQAIISVLPSSLFRPAKLINFSAAPPSYAYVRPTLLLDRNACVISGAPSPATHASAMVFIVKHF